MTISIATFAFVFYSTDTRCTKTAYASEWLSLGDLWLNEINLTQDYYLAGYAPYACMAIHIAAAVKHVRKSISCLSVSHDIGPPERSKSLYLNNVKIVRHPDLAILGCI
jgi:hypothetical protein